MINNVAPWKLTVKSIVKIIVHHQGADTGEMGTGFICSSTRKVWLVTCAHLFLDNKNQHTGDIVRVIAPDNPQSHFEFDSSRFQMDRQFRTTHQDLALMEWDSMRPQSIPLTFRPSIRLGGLFYLCGHSNDLDWKIKKIKSVLPPEIGLSHPNIAYFELCEGDVAGVGDSGGPILDPNGNIVGVASFQPHRYANLIACTLFPLDHQ